MPTYNDDEGSVSSALPAELYTIITPATTYRLTSYSAPITFSGNTWAVAPISRDNFATNAIDGQSTAVRQVTIEVSLNHALAQDLLVGGVPWAQDVTVQIGTYMQRSAALQQWFFGTLASISSDGTTAKLIVSGKLDQKLSVQLPLAVAQRLCQHALYDAGCQIVPASFQVSATVVSVSGTTVVISTIGGKPDRWARYGLIKRTADSEPRAVVDQVGTTITVDVAFRALNPGDAITLNAGCDLTIAVCNATFSNRANYGGHPQLPTANIQSPLGFGVTIEIGE